MNTESDPRLRAAFSLEQGTNRRVCRGVTGRRLSDGTVGVATVGYGDARRRHTATTGTEHRNAHHAGRCGLRIHIVLFHCCYLF